MKSLSTHILAWLFGVALVGWGATAAAHPARTTAVFLDIHAPEVALEAQIPVDQLEMALQQPLEREGARLSRYSTGVLRAYLPEHIRVEGSQGQAWPTPELHSLSLKEIDGAEHVVAHLVARAPEEAALESFTLRYDVILHRVVSHKILVFLRQDLEQGRTQEAPLALGTLRYQRASLLVERAQASWWRAASAMAVLGAEHIALGLDHLLFLLLLLVPASWKARRGRWARRRSGGEALAHVLKVASAFTLGHSLTLALGAWGAVSLPMQPVEVVIAASILLTAVHAVRPLAPRGELWIAGIFGLVHGLAFAEILGALGLSGAHLGKALLAFNLGIEATQVAVILLVVPALHLLSRGRLVEPLRWAAGLGGGAMALYWVTERVLLV